MRLFFYISLIVACLCSTVQAQTSGLVKKGNELYDQKKYKEATEDYLKALQKNPNYTPGMFNLGNALYKQKQYEGARKVLENTAKLDTNKLGKSAANYNIGNTYMSEQKWEEAIDAYKKALRANPQDADAKYNLSYAQQMLKKQQGGGGKNDKKDNKDDKNNKDKNKGDNKDDKSDKKDENKDDKGKEENKGEKEQQQQKPESQPSKLTEKQAEQILNALQQEEKKLQDKHKKEKGVPVKVDKDW
ncbi:MAG: tetratricopeptide repeat protein [Bacteroidetes bacterium]|nr:tetratricopeptide repeat protein [Bacteroidota bacterium]